MLYLMQIFFLKRIEILNFKIISLNLILEKAEILWTLTWNVYIFYKPKQQETKDWEVCLYFSFLIYEKHDK
jgi:hypothetical protein